jgi:hypothetical protein
MAMSVVVASTGARATVLGTATLANVRATAEADLVAREVSLQAAPPVQRFVLNGTVVAQNALTRGSNLRIRFVAPDGQSHTYTPFPNVNTFLGAPLTLDEVYVNLETPMSVISGTWRIECYDAVPHSLAPAVDAIWTTLTVRFENNYLHVPSCPTEAVATISGVNQFALGEPGDPTNSVMVGAPSAAGLVGAIQLSGQVRHGRYIDEVQLVVTPPGMAPMVLEPFGGRGRFLSANVRPDERIVVPLPRPIPASAGVWRVEAADRVDDPSVDYSWAAVCVALVPASPRTWYEAEHAPAADQSLINAREPHMETGRSIGSIVGTLEANGADVYRVDICDTGAFVAEVRRWLGAPDTQLFLFDADGMGVIMNDDSPVVIGDRRSRLDGEHVLAPGTYYLAITASNRDPIASTGERLWLDVPYEMIRAADGEGAGRAFAEWFGETPAAGTYEIALSGVAGVGSCNPGCPGCPADFDQDGGTTPADIGAFFAAFTAGETCADADEDGGITPADVAAFFTVFDQGGC